MERLQRSMNENKFDIAAKCIEEFETLEKEDEAEEKQIQAKTNHLKLNIDDKIDSIGI